MKTTYSVALSRGVFPHEGGYTNHPSDPGGPTNWGITIADARKYWRADAAAEDVRDMPKAVAEDIYRRHYAAPLRYDELPAGVDYAVLDYGINSGISRAAKVLQRVCGETDDGRIGPDTLAAVSKRDPVDLVNAICDERLRFLKQLKTWPVFGNGWGRRVAEVRSLALHFAKDPTPVAMSNAPAAGKGAVPPPIAAKTAASAGASTATAVAGASLWDWVTAHPVEASLIGAAIAAAVIAVFVLIDRRHAAEQDAPTPGFMPVPEKP